MENPPYPNKVNENLHYKKSCLPGRTWSSAVVDGDHPARILGPPWPIRKLCFFVFEALYSHGFG